MFWFLLTMLLTAIVLLLMVLITSSAIIIATIVDVIRPYIVPIFIIIILWYVLKKYKDNIKRWIQKFKDRDKF